jgi:glyoxylase I family protein
MSEVAGSDSGSGRRPSLTPVRGTTGMQEKFRIRKIDHVVLRARDSERMIAFYCDVLGCSLEKRSTVVEGLVHLRAGESFIDIMSASESLEYADGAAGNMDHFCVQVEDFTEAEVTAHLAKYGIKTSEFERRFGSDGYGQSVYIRDPEGNEVELKLAPQVEDIARPEL